VIEAACAGFLLAVLWMDLIFDSQVLSHRGAAELPEPVLASIAAYYHRATTTSRPMSLLIASVMVILLLALAFRWVDDPGWSLALPSILAAAPILLAAAHTVPSAKRLGLRVDDSEGQTRLARAICGDHLLCLVGISLFLAVWVAG
jgi:multisubunit Na+/H+ antiporter MnhB subunit